MSIFRSFFHTHPSHEISLRWHALRGRDAKSLYLHEEDDAGPQVATGFQPREDSMRILIVEDEPIIALELERIVREEGHQVVGLAATLEQALAHAHRTDAALVDVGLADGASGAVLARRLIDRFQIKVIFITGAPGAIGSGLEGSLDVIAKPFTDDAVRRSLARAVAVP